MNSFFLSVFGAYLHSPQAFRHLFLTSRPALFFFSHNHINRLHLLPSQMFPQHLLHVALQKYCHHGLEHLPFIAALPHVL